MKAPPLRILQLNSIFNGGGADSQTLDLAIGLHSLGHAVRVAIAADCRWEARLAATGLPSHSFPGKTFMKRGLVLSVARTLRRDRAHIIHAHQGRDYWPAILAARLAACGTRVFVTRHLMTRPRRGSRWLLLRCAHIVAVSKAVERVLRAELHGPAGRIHQVCCGIDSDAFVPARTARGSAFREQHGWQPEHVVFGVVGVYHLPRGKGQVEFLEAAARISRETPGARFAVIGNGSMAGLLRQRHGELGLGEALTFVPFTEDNAAMINALDVVVHPAVGTDAFPLVVLEGMASGKPVIASNLDGIPEQFEDGVQGWLVPPAQVPALAEAMAALARDPGCRERMGQAGRARVTAKFTRQHLAMNVERIYREVLAQAGYP